MFGTDSVHCTPRTMTGHGVNWGSRVSALLSAEERVFRPYHAAGVTSKVANGCCPQLDVAEVVALSAALS